MKYGLDLPNMRECADPKLLAEIAKEAEDSGWDGVFIFDSLYSPDWVPGDGPPPTADPWISLAAMAAATSAVRLGPMIAPLSRHKPWKLARELVTLDHLSNGRMVLPVGLGFVGDGGYASVGEELDRKKRAEMLDEALEIITGLWSGKRYSFEGKHYHVKEMTFLPKPVQSPRIPIWAVGAWPRPKSMRRALRWDGVAPVVLGNGADPAPEVVGRALADEGAYLAMTSEDVTDIAGYVKERRESGAPYDIVLEGWSSPSDGAKAAAKLAEFAEAGATWWVEAIWSWLYLPPHDIGRMRERIRQGPPRA